MLMYAYQFPRYATSNSGYNSADTFNIYAVLGDDGSSKVAYMNLVVDEGGWGGALATPSNPTEHATLATSRHRRPPRTPAQRALPTVESRRVAPTC